MSLVRRRRLVDKVTVWSRSGYDASDPYGSGWSTPVVYDCNYMSGGSLQRDTDGTEFQPSLTIRLWGVSVSLGDKLAIGDYTFTRPVDNAEVVRAVNQGSTLRGVQDVTVFTG